MMRAVLPIAAALLLAGCGHSPATRFLTLDPAPAAPTTVRADYAGPPLVLSAVKVPAAVDRIEYVRQSAAGQIAVSDFDRWSAPPGTLLRDVLLRDLTTRLPEGAVLATAAPTRAGAVRVDVTVLALDPSAGTMQAAFTENLPGGTPMERVANLSTASAADARAGAEAVSAMAGQLADQIVAALPKGSRKRR